MRHSGFFVFLLLLFYIPANVQAAALACLKNTGKPAFQSFNDGNFKHLYSRSTEGDLLEWSWLPELGWWTGNLSSGSGLSIAGNPVLSGKSWPLTRDDNGYLYQWQWTEENGWIARNLTNQTQGQRVSGDPAYYYTDTSERIFTRSVGGHLVEWAIDWYWLAPIQSWRSNGWRVTDLSAVADNVEIAGTPAYLNNGDYQYVFARSAQGALLEWRKYQDTAWRFNNLSDLTGGQNIAGDPVAAGDGQIRHVFARDTDDRLLEWWWNVDSGWHLTDLSAFAGGIKIKGVPAYFNDSGVQHVLARDAGDHLREWWWMADSGWHVEDLSDAGGSPQTITGDPVYAQGDGSQHVFAMDASGDLREWWWTADSGWHIENVSLLSNPGCAVGEDIGGQNRYLYQVMRDRYLWYRELPETNPDDYASPSQMLDTVKYQVLDKWSYIVSTKAYNDLFNAGTYTGLGYSSGFDAKGRLKLSYVFKISSAALAGLQRGDEIVEINGKTIQQIHDGNLWDSIYGPAVYGTPVSLKVRKFNGQEQTLSLFKRKVEIDIILNSMMLGLSGLPKTAYLAFDSFIANANTLLSQEFAFFKKQGAKELILDLRYNSGGRLNIASHLGSLIAGEKAAGQVFERIILNDKHSEANSDELFTSPAPVQSLNLDRVFVITTASTCSASEAVINALRPFLQVIVIGDTTCGKPVGMYPRLFADKVLSMVEFEGINSRGEGAYFNGIAPDCRVSDDLSAALGDPVEASLAEALHYLQNGQCSTQSLKRAQSKASPRSVHLTGFYREIGGH